MSLRSVLLALVTALLVLTRAAAGTPALGWPAVEPTHRPWTRWWWPGSAVDSANLTSQLEEFARVGLGGVEITPIYGVEGAETRELRYLSPPWCDAFAHVLRESQRLGLGVDLASGTGWPFGGPGVPPTDALQRAHWRDGRAGGEPTGMLVKRAAPGGEGLVLDPFSAAAVQRYLARFDPLFAVGGDRIRAQFHDSFEYFDAGWTPTLEQVFADQHGYALADHGAALFRDDDTEETRRVKSDYRATLATLHLDYLVAWTDWAHAHGNLTRNQSHGAPANLLDLYGAVDIPETETFGSTPFPIPGLRREPSEVRPGLDLPDPMVMRFASSAGHVMGRRLISSESCTWLREHWKTALAFAKPELDRLFVSGINHIFYHGTAYSPADAAWPGWLFYASTEFQPTNPWWRDFPALNAYVTRVQSVLQSGHPDNDVLVYWPFADVIDDPRGLTRQLTVHHVEWLRDSPAGQVGERLARAGYGFDYVSDAQLAGLRADRGEFISPGDRYRALVVPATRRMPPATLHQLLALASQAPVIFLAAPEDVPGLGRLEDRRREFNALLPGVHPLLAPDAVSALQQQGILPEAWAPAGLEFIRRARDDGHDYFVANLGAEPVARWFRLAKAATVAALLNPLDGTRGRGALRTDADGATSIYLQLQPGESLLVRTLTSGPGDDLPPWSYEEIAGAPTTLAGPWRVEFIAGGPDRPAAATRATLSSWTDWNDEAASRFAGTARYRLEFEAPAAAADDWVLDLGDVRESARVRLNGREIAVAWSLPFRVRVGPTLRPGRNELEIEVTNLAANRIRDLDRRGVRWRIMHEINFVDINYRPFDASRWTDTPSGLLGPVRLLPLRHLNPASRP